MAALDELDFVFVLDVPGLEQHVGGVGEGDIGHQPFQVFHREEDKHVFFDPDLSASEPFFLEDLGDELLGVLDQELIVDEPLLDPRLFPDHSLDVPGHDVERFAGSRDDQREEPEDVGRIDGAMGIVSGVVEHIDGTEEHQCIHPLLRHPCPDPFDSPGAPLLLRRHSRPPSRTYRTSPPPRIPPEMGRKGWRLAVDSRLT